ncbi:carbohydrate-binding protein [Streptomyces sp. NPDC021020]|uniref:carbohydrate-binding protein n=1 Tax=Streptomyces sp. NPDC021020 TaxID=3365109 RepID=UPI0037A20AD4
MAGGALVTFGAAGTAGAAPVTPRTYAPPALRTCSGWRFHKGDVTGAQAPAFNDSAWTALSVPHTWNAQDGADGGGDYYRGVGWYRRRATLPAFTSEAAAILSGGGSGSVWNARTKVPGVVTAEIPVSTNGGTVATVEPSGAAFPAVGGGTVHEAEDARLDSTFVVDTLHPGYTGTGYADFNGTSAGSTISWTVDVPSAGKKQLLVRYANGGDTDRPADIDVNGTKITSLAMPPTGGWDAWKTASCTATLPQGTGVTVRVTLTKAIGANIDSLVVE